ncbi:MAG: hypothetical protein CM1200mP10_19790 [Candidatus Neomarinimicrobiota bacterium]|nr:MAG: hypothetical protein CM1200mP10_19790 [Candidatus Neomarinimicrobiota bacterium]
MVNKVMNDLINKGYVVRGWLGVAIQEIDDSYAKHWVSRRAMVH